MSRERSGDLRSKKFNQRPGNELQETNNKKEQKTKKNTKDNREQEKLIYRVIFFIDQIISKKLIFCFVAAASMDVGLNSLLALRYIETESMKETINMMLATILMISYSIFISVFYFKKDQTKRIESNIKQTRLHRPTQNSTQARDRGVTTNPTEDQLNLIEGRAFQEFKSEADSMRYFSSHTALRISLSLVLVFSLKMGPVLKILLYLTILLAEIILIALINPYKHGFYFIIHLINQIGVILTLLIILASEAQSNPISERSRGLKYTELSLWLF